MQSEEPEDCDFVFRRWADFEYLVVSLFRVRRCAEMVARLPGLEEPMCAALADFDNALPHLRVFRNVAEHIDDYAVDRGRDKSIHRFSLESSNIEDDGQTFAWLGHSLNAKTALHAAETLFKSLQDCVRFVPRDV